MQEEQRGFGGLFVFGEIALDAALLLAAEGRIGEDHVHAVALADVGELAVGPGAFLLIDKGEQFVAGDAVGFGGPIAPAVGWFDGRIELLSGELGLALALKFQVSNGNRSKSPFNPLSFLMMSLADLRSVPSDYAAVGKAWRQDEQNGQDERSEIFLQCGFAACALISMRSRLLQFEIL